MHEQKEMGDAVKQEKKGGGEAIICWFTCPSGRKCLLACLFYCLATTCLCLCLSVCLLFLCNHGCNLKSSGIKSCVIVLMHIGRYIGLKC